LTEINAPGAGLEKLCATRAPTIELPWVREARFRLPRSMQGCPYLSGSRPQSNVGRGGGGNVGVNEDSLWIGKGRLAQSNAEQVKMDRQILEGLGLEIAKPDAARDILALKGPNKVQF
jgi:hypothetical protein